MTGLNIGLTLLIGKAIIRPHPINKKLKHENKRDNGAGNNGSNRSSKS